MLTVRVVRAGMGGETDGDQEDGECYKGALAYEGPPPTNCICEKATQWAADTASYGCYDVDVAAPGSDLDEGDEVCFCQ